ncbi:MAG: hypothetical protein OXD42_07315 [Rhodospirillaceae bacterium]|nr:hypothetical protein [Rhodospirillaceae bacterium]
MKPLKSKAKLPRSVTITLPEDSYQPRKAESEKQYDMPGASITKVRQAFFRPVIVKRKKSL